MLDQKYTHGRVLTMVEDETFVGTLWEQEKKLRRERWNLWKKRLENTRTRDDLGTEPAGARQENKQRNSLYLLARHSAMVMGGL